MSGGRAVPFGLMTKRLGMEILGIAGLPRSMAFGMAACAKETESSVANTIVGIISPRRPLRRICTREVGGSHPLRGWLLIQKGTREWSGIAYVLTAETHMRVSRLA